MDAATSAAVLAAERDGDLPRAIGLLVEALRLDTEDLGAHTRLGVLYATHGRAAEAVREFAAVVARRPTSAPALYNLARAQAAAGDLDAAAAGFSLAADAAPRNAEIFLAWALALEDGGRAESALHVYGRAESVGCEEGTLRMCRGLALHRLGRHEEAGPQFLRAAQLRPEIAAEAHYNRGVCMASASRHETAVEAYTASLAVGPREPQTLVNRGISRVELGQVEDALQDYREALGVQPELRNGLRAAGIACLLLGRWDESRRHLEHALRLDPNDDEAWAALGDHHRLCQDFAAAAECYHRSFAALEARDAPPRERAELLNKRLDALIALSDFGLARTCALELRATHPDFPYAAGLELFATAWTANWSAFEPLRAEVVAGAGRGEPTALPWLLCSVTDDPWIQRRAADAFIARHHAEVDRLPSTAPKARARLRVGYLSPDFRDHPVGQLVAATLEGHDRTRFEVHGFSTHAHTPAGPLRSRLEAACDQFHDVALLDDRAVARRIRDAGIDVLVDLAGHTTGGRPGIVARRPAAIQINFLGYPATYGGNLMDYLIADSYLVPEALEAAYGERIVRLPGSAVPPGDGRPAAGTAPDRVALGLPRDAPVLAAIHNTYKILPETFATWMRLLHAHPRAVLWISRHDPAGERGLRAAVGAAGVDASRVVFADRVVGRSEYLARLGAADLFLDTHPYNAHSSAADALWAGVPVVTRSGASFASRVCGGLLHALGLDALVTDSLEAYESTASTLLASPAALADLKTWLTTRGRSSSVFDPVAYTRNLETAYETMWARAVRGAAPASFAVAAPATDLGVSCARRSSG